jgi:hypothetical protein
MATHQQIQEFKEAVRDMTNLCREIVEHPEMLDQFTQDELAFLEVGFEQLIGESKSLMEKVEKLLEQGEKS